VTAISVSNTVNLLHWISQGTLNLYNLESLDQEYKKWYYFSSVMFNTTAYFFSNPYEVA
jgi:hypothetical protein